MYRQSTGSYDMCRQLSMDGALFLHVNWHQINHCIPICKINLDKTLVFTAMMKMIQNMGRNESMLTDCNLDWFNIHA